MKRAHGLRTFGLACKTETNWTVGALNLFVIGEVSSALCGSQVVEKLNNDIDCASYGSR